MAEGGGEQFTVPELERGKGPVQCPATGAGFVRKAKDQSCQFAVAGPSGVLGIRFLYSLTLQYLSASPYYGRTSIPSPSQPWLYHTQVNVNGISFCTPGLRSRLITAYHYVDVAMLVVSLACC